jgi:DNA-binding response OmpR family regulator
VRLLVVEDDDIVADAITRGLAAANYSVHRVANAEDDFLSKPFEAAELAARCRALMRRANGASSGTIKLNRMSVDLVGKRLCVDDAEVALTAREWLVLECLIRRVGLIVSKERLQQAVANPDHDTTPNAVEVHISRLRAKLGTAAVVRSLRGLGYRLEEAKPA